jgi:hypothetical protein
MGKRAGEGGRQDAQGALLIGASPRAIGTRRPGRNGCGQPAVARSALVAWRGKWPRRSGNWVGVGWVVTSAWWMGQEWLVQAWLSGRYSSRADEATNRATRCGRQGGLWAESGGGYVERDVCRRAWPRAALAWRDPGRRDSREGAEGTVAIRDGVAWLMGHSARERRWAIWATW